MVLTKEDFKAKWDSDDEGGGITYEDIADCAKAWGLFQRPKTCPIDMVSNRVLLAAGCETGYFITEDED